MAAAGPVRSVPRDVRAIVWRVQRLKRAGWRRASNMRLTVSATAIALCLLVMPAWGAGQLQQPPLPVGTRITMQNWQKYQSYLPQGIIEMWKGTHPWKLPADAVMEVGPSVEYPISLWGYEATEKYKG